ncbi:MAG: hypothetical protein HN857_00240 [Gammaproteobacteria bacterium]|nr:hypothetical protein [Gammaproteobacteria bacterium]
MNKLFTAVTFLTASSLAIAGGHGGSMDHSSHASAAKSGSGVHFFGRLYLGYDNKTTGAADSVDNIRDNGGKSRLGIKFKENLGAISLIGHAEWKFDIADGTSGADSTTACTGARDCRTFDLHVGNLGFLTPLGYLGMGSYESPYKTMGMYDSNMDTALALNSHGGTSDGAFGIEGTWDSSVSYHGAMGPMEIAYMRGMADDVGGSNAANVAKGDYAFGLRLKHIMPGLEFGFARAHDKSGASNYGTSNDKIFASYKVMPGVGVFYTNEDIEIAGTNHGAGDITTMGLHYTMGNNMIQLVAASGNMDTATTDYDTYSISNQMNLSKSTNLVIGYTRKGIEGAGNAVRTYGLGLTHKF